MKPLPFVKFHLPIPKISVQPNDELYIKTTNTINQKFEDINKYQYDREYPISDPLKKEIRVIDAVFISSPL